MKELATHNSPANFTTEFVTEFPTEFPKKFDFLFIGLGAANCLLLLRLSDNNLLAGKTIAIIEPDSKSANDRTFCFWATDEELTKLHLKKLVSYSWDYIEIGNIIKEKIAPLRYFHIKGIDLYNETKNVLSGHNVSYFASLLKEKPQIKPNHYEIKLENELICANKVFDSRPPSFSTPQKNQNHLHQSFFGWQIKTNEKVFDTSTILMMDFDIPQNNFTQFVYVLPFSEDTALVELTRFGEEKLSYNEAELILNDYVKNINASFEVLEYEKGVIPMSSAGIKIDDFGENWINMGARANMLKCTTGYAFHAMAEDALLQAEALKNSELAKRKSKKQRFVFYDRLLLKILNESPEYGKVIFETLFKKVPVVSVLRFLREKTTLSEEVVIFSKLQKMLFVKTAIKDLWQQMAHLPILVLPFLLTILTLICSIILPLKNQEYVSWGILGIGFLSVGLSHGALDHLTQNKMNNNKELFYFSINYLLKSAVLGLVWLFLPDIALIIFIAYSAWHFGQADFKEWGLKHGLQSFIWGFVVLMVILFFHFNELKQILGQIPNLTLVDTLKTVSQTQTISFQIGMIILGIFLAVINKSKHIFFTLAYLLISSELPLLISFGIYFIWQHSLHGWHHLLLNLKESSSRLWLKSLPFSFGGAVIILYFIFYAGANYVGIFFIILSCLSIPHVISMHQFYSKIK